MESALSYKNTLEKLLLYSVHNAIERRKKYKHFIKNISFLLAKKGFTGADIINNLPLPKKEKPIGEYDELLIDEEHIFQIETEVSTKVDIKKILSDNPYFTLLNLQSFFASRKMEIVNQEQELAKIDKSNSLNEKEKKEEEVKQIETLLNRKRGLDTSLD